MISRKTLIISPLLTVGAVTAVLVGAAHWLASPEPPPPIVYEEMVDCHRTVDVPQDLGPLSVQSFPTYFQGYFHWDGETRADQQNVGLDVHDVDLNEQGLIVATGRATYNTNFRNIDFSFRIEVNPDTNEFVMWESEPNKGGFVTTGRHEATIASFDNIDATWIGDNGDTGVLKLWPAEGSMRFFSDDTGEDAPRRQATSLGGGVYLQKGKVTDTSCVTSMNDMLTIREATRGSDGVFHVSSGDPEPFAVQDAPPGWQIALLNMCEGETARVWMPAHLAYPGHNPDEFAPGGYLMVDLEVDDLITDSLGR